MKNFQRAQIVRKMYLLAAGLGLACGFLGYLMQYNWNLTALPGVLLYTLHLFIPRPAIVLDDSLNILVRSGAFFCGISGFVAAGLLWVAAANRTVSDLWTQVWRRGHVLVVGDGAFAHRFADRLQERRRDVVHAVPVDIPIEADTPAKHRIPHIDHPRTLAARAGLMRANQVVIDTGSDTETLAAATGMLEHLDKTPGAQMEHIAIRVADPVLSDQFFERMARKSNPVQVTLSVFDENTILARYALAHDPLFMRASARHQSRVHALIVGFGDLGEKLMDQILLTSLARDLACPRISIIDRDAEARRKAFEARRPNVLSQLPITFYQIDIGADPFENARPAAVKDLCAAEVQDPFTMIYLALPSQGEVTRAALLMDRLHQRTGIFAAPIAYRCHVAAESFDFLEQPMPSLSQEQGFVRLSVPPDQVAQSVLGVAEADRMAIRIHEAYRKAAQASSDADMPWAKLKDTYKRSNRRTLDHLPAKLWTMGVRPENMTDLTATDRGQIEALLAGSDNDPKMMKLAELEHDRWCIDRRLDGWTSAEKRDNARRHHDRLIPFEQLKALPGEVEKDITHIRGLLRIVLDGYS